MEKKYRLIKFLSFLLLINVNINIYGYNPNTIKIALLDTPFNEVPEQSSFWIKNKSALSSYIMYGQAYVSGVQAAAHSAKKYGINIEYKAFFYGQAPLDVLGEIQKIQSWGADLIIGPSASDQFLLLRNYIPDTMVLSSYASDINLKTLPKNFYTMFFLDNEIMRLLSEYIHKKFSEKNIYILIQTDCKQCVDAGRIFVEQHKKISPDTKIVENKLIMDNIEDIDANRILGKHKDEVILIFNDAYYSYKVLVQHFVDSFPGEKLIFFSDQDNWDENASISDQKNDSRYQSYRIGPILFDDKLPEFRDFEQSYIAINKTKPVYAVSYITYITIMSAVEALKRFSDPNVSKSMRDKILYAYLMALNKNPNWFKIRYYGIYRVSSKGEVLIEKLPPLE